MSFMKVISSQHDPTMKLMSGTYVAVPTISLTSSSKNAIIYPDGVFQLKGILCSREFKKTVKTGTLLFIGRDVFNVIPNGAWQME